MYVRELREQSLRLLRLRLDFRNQIVGRSSAAVLDQTTVPFVYVVQVRRARLKRRSHCDGREHRLAHPVARREVRQQVLVRPSIERAGVRPLLRQELPRDTHRLAPSLSQL